jgi:predicted nucleic acid-binding protein
MLLDTSGLLCLHSDAEPHHSEAVAAYRDSRLRVTHNYILAEYVALANARRMPRSETLRFLFDLAENPEVIMVWINEATHAEAMNLLESRADKSYSLCDAVSFVLMRRLAILDALTTDHHFDQEGFVRRLL